MTAKPAIAMVAMPGRRQRMIELAQEAERRGFPGVYCPSPITDCMALCQAIAQATKTLRVGTSIQPIYFRAPAELAHHAAFIHEVSGGRFDLGVGVSHADMQSAFGVAGGKPLGDMRAYVEAMRAVEPVSGPLPPLIIAALRDKMLALASEIAEGAVWAWGSLSFVRGQIARQPAVKREGFFLGSMLSTVIDEDEAAAAAVLKPFLTEYMQRPNYRNYWRAAGYVEEMDAAEAAIARGEIDRLPRLISERWLRDIAVFGSATKVRDGVEAWRDAGIKTPILVPSSTRGGQTKAIAELFAAWD